MMSTTRTTPRRGLAGAVTATAGILALTGCAESLRASAPIHPTQALQAATVQQACRAAADGVAVLRLTGQLENTAQDPIQLGAPRLAHPTEDLTLIGTSTMAGVTLRPGDRLEVIVDLGHRPVEAGTSPAVVDVLVPYRQGDALYTALIPVPQPWPTTQCR